MVRDSLDSKEITKESRGISQDRNPFRLARRNAWHLHGSGRLSLNIDNLPRLRSGNHVLQVGVFIDRSVRIGPLFVFALDAPLLLVLLLLLSRLLSAAFFQLVFLKSSWLLDYS